MLEASVEHLVGLLPPRVVEALSAAKARVRRVRAERWLAPVIGEVAPGADYEILAALAESAVARVAVGGATSVILKAATSPTASKQLTIEADALDELGRLGELAEWRSLIATVDRRGTHAGGTWFTQTLVPGVAMSRVDDDAVALVVAAAAAVRPLHLATTTRVEASGGLLESLVDQPIETIRSWRPGLVDELDGIRAEVRSRLDGRELALARLHGDFAPSNLLWDRRAGAVSGIVDWKFAERLLPPEIDLVHLALALTSERDRAEYGAVVTAVMTGNAGETTLQCVDAAAAAGPNDLRRSTAVMLAWIQHVSFGFEKAPDLRTNPIWLHNNVDSVIAALAAAK